MQTTLKNLIQPVETIEEFCERWHITEFVLFGRKVDLLIKGAISRISNWLRRQNILESAEVIYAKVSCKFD